MPIKRIIGLWKILKETFSGFVDHKVPKLSGSLAYYTVFSMGPLLLMIISFCGLFFGREAVEGTIYSQLEGFVGHDTALQLQHIIKNASISGKSILSAIIGGITLLIGATGVFAEIQDSINMIWGLKAKPKKGLIIFLRTRILSFSVIASLGFLLLVSLGVSALIESFSNRLQTAYPQVTVTIFYVINVILTFAITTAIFGVVFKVLPDAQIGWKDVTAGAITTAILFMLGKFAISYYISKVNIGTTYGTAGSLVIVLLWIYYSSIILYFGAEFTKAYALSSGKAIHPSQYAVTTQQVQIETGKAPVTAH
jgi:membrane protein